MRAVPTLALAIGLVACSPSGVGSGTPTIDAETVRVVGVTDGDTFDIPGDAVRLIGVNAPERDECWGSEATEALEGILGERVRLEFDVEERDRFGRVLAYVWTPEGGFVNEALVADGHALARAYEPNTARQSVLADAEASAIERGAGLWSGCTSDAATIGIDDFEANPPGPDEDDLNGEWVSLRNDGDEPVSLAGWELRDESASNRFSFPEVTLEPGAVLTVRTGCGADTGDELHWCSDTPVWSNGGDTIFLLDADGKQVDVVSYGS